MTDKPTPKTKLNGRNPVGNNISNSGLSTILKHKYKSKVGTIGSFSDLKSATFTFNENGNFDITTTANSELFGMLTEMMDGAKWKFEKSKQQVRIGTEKDGYTTMVILLREENGARLFHLLESELTLQMKKVL
ncbi:MAG: hypothetical protein KDC50_07915 [Flavobacterium sp.]|nr:hypothetical protein [Flavobacterium sp.]